MSELAEGSAAWAIPWPCVHEFLAIVTHPRICDPPTPIAAALAQVDAWLESPTLVLISESDQHWSELRELVIKGRSPVGASMMRVWPRSAVSMVFASFGPQIAISVAFRAWSWSILFPGEVGPSRCLQQKFTLSRTSRGTVGGVRRGAIPC